MDHGWLTFNGECRNQRYDWSGMAETLTAVEATLKNAEFEMGPQALATTVELGKREIIREVSTNFDLPHVIIEFGRNSIYHRAPIGVILCGRCCHRRARLVSQFADSTRVVYGNTEA